MSQIVTIVLACALAQAPAMRPRPDYPVKARIPEATVAAVALSPAQVKAAFGTDTYKNFIVVEVTVFPYGGTLDLSPKDFMMKAGAAGALLRPTPPSTAALTIDEKNNPTHPPEIHSPVNVSAASTIGYDSAGTYNPNTGKRQGGVYTATEVDISAAGPSWTPPRADRGRGFDTMDAELRAKALPETRVTHPVAGYLYFIPPKKRPNGPYELTYAGDTARVTLIVPAPAR